MATFFFYVESPKGEVAAFTDEDGLSVPIFTEQPLALTAARNWAGDEAGVALLASDRVQEFSQACGLVGAKSLRMDPILKDIEAGGVTYLDLQRNQEDT